MENANNWYFTKEQLASTPSRRCGIDANKELSYRQQAANFIQDMGQRLQVSQLCINTAIVYMHRFYVFHSFTEIHRNNLSVAALFLAAKVEEQPRKLEHVIKIAHACLHKDAPPLDVRSEAYAEKQFEVVTNESILLQTLGFVLGIEHPHTYVVKLCQMVKACKDLAQTSYFMATTSLHMTTMCLQYKPTVVAAVCIHLACKWSSWKNTDGAYESIKKLIYEFLFECKIEPCSEGKEWYYYVDKTVSPETIEALTQDFVAILESSPHRFKKKFIPHKAEASSHVPRNILEDSSKHHPADNKSSSVKKEVCSPGPSTSISTFSLNPHAVEKTPKVSVKVENSEKHHLPSQPVHSPLEVPKKMKVASHSISIDAYREKKEKERLELKLAPQAPVESNVQQPITNKSQLALNDHDKEHKHVPNSVELIPHSSKEKTNRNIISQEPQHQVHPAPISKVNHHFPKKQDLLHSKENKSNLLKIPSNVSNDPVVVLERVDVKSEVRDSSVTEKSQASPCKLKNAQDSFPAPVDNVPESKNSVSVSLTTSPLAVTKSKHHRHKANSVRSNHNSIHPHSQKHSPDKDIKTNGSKETELNEKKNSIIENSVINVKTPDKHEISKHEKREKYKSKHSSSSSKDKSVNSESLNPIKVKIRKEVINKLPEKSPKVQSSKEESPKTSLKIKLPKPPPTAVVPEPGPLKIVLTKDKSGSGAYCTSRKNERESRKRVHSPSSRHEANYKSSGETPNKHIKLDHAHSSHSSSKQSKVRHSSSRHTDHISNSVSSNKLLNIGNDSNDYHNVVESYVDPNFYGNQYFVQMSPPPQPPPLPPPPPPDSSASGYKIKTNYNHYLSTQLPPPPPPE